MQNKTLHSFDKYPILNLLSYVWVIIMAFSGYVGLDHPWISAGALILELAIVYFSLTTVDVLITDNEIIKGTKYNFIPGLKQSKTFNRNEYEGLSLVQNKKKYFEITATNSNQKGITLTSLPNQNPAKEKMAELEAEIAVVWTEIAV
ncbi:MAG: hypothetical protein GQ574_25175 [Crocinitomix sp.]|nr:hypothetical protein [Crocinitomix sp.]